MPKIKEPLTDKKIKAEIIRDIIKSLPKNEIIENKKELLSFAENLDDVDLSTFFRTHFEY